MSEIDRGLSKEEEFGLGGLNMKIKKERNEEGKMGDGKKCVSVSK